MIKTPVKEQLERTGLMKALIFISISILLIYSVYLFISFLQEPRFEITKDGVVVEGIKIFIYENGSIEGIVPYNNKKGSKTFAINVIDTYDLSRDWLNSNCQCMNYCNKTDCVYTGGSGLKAGEEETCVKWHCADYEVKLK